MTTENNIIELRHVKKCYEKDTPVIKDFSLTIKKGEFVTFLGPSGCGKTTILRMIGGFEQPTGGEILLHGKDISKLPPAKRPINTVFQKYALFPYLNIYDNIAFGLKMKKVQKRDRDEVYKEARELLRKVGLAEKENSYPGQLSGGQQQRVAIARALAMNPKMLFFDEPTSALDPEITAGILKVLRELAQEKMTMVIVTHEIAFARKVADRVIFMDSGVIVEQGKPEDVIDNPDNERTKAFLQKLS